MLIPDYFDITARSRQDDALLYHVRLNPDADVYRGHFPGHPVSPGVCSLALIRECTADATGKPWEIRRISRCRFLSLITPQTNPELRIEIRTGDSDGAATLPVSARILDGDRVCVEFKGEMEVAD